MQMFGNDGAASTINCHKIKDNKDLNHFKGKNVRMYTNRKVIYKKIRLESEWKKEKLKPKFY